MGVRSWMQRHKFDDATGGTFEVRTCVRGKSSGLHVDVDATGLLAVGGLGTFPVEFHGKVPHQKVPTVGQVLPVTVDRADHTHFMIEWDQVPTDAQRWEEEAAIAREQLTTMPTGFGNGGIGGPGGGFSVTVLNGDLSSLPPDTQQTLQSVLGSLGSLLQQGSAGANVTVEQPQVTINGVPVDPNTGHPQSPGTSWTPASATVLTCHDAALPASAASHVPGGVVDLTLDIRLADGTGYSTTTRVAFSTPERRAKVTTVGTELPVLVNPADRTNVAIDTSRILNW